MREVIRLRELPLFRRHGLLEPDIIDNPNAWAYDGGFSVHTNVRVPRATKGSANAC